MKITKIKLHNFKRFKDIEVSVDPILNMFIGDNESGKSSILQAIDIVARGSRTHIEEIGLERLLNVDVVSDFMAGDRRYENLPEMYVELYLNDMVNPDLIGKNNSKGVNCAGIKMHCHINDEYGLHVKTLLANQASTFPVEFYSVTFDTFAGEPYNGYNRKLRTLYIDNSNIGSPYSMREYVRAVYKAHADDVKRIELKHAYHENKLNFQNTKLKIIDVQPYALAIRESVDDNIETAITLTENDIPIENKGTGLQCYIKTELALLRAANGIDTVLLEEPENHLCYAKMLQLIQKIQNNNDRQLFISTHSDMIATRLNLKNCILLNSAKPLPLAFNSISEDTAKFFMKAPDNNMLQFVLSKKVLLVEGDAEYILMEALYKRVTGNEIADSGISVIAVDGKCFKRYLEIAKVIHVKVAVITDNDGNYQDNIEDNYADYMNRQFPNIQVFADSDNNRYTFEVCMYKENTQTCNDVFSFPRRKLSIQDYMLSNKAEAAFKLLSDKADVLTVPEYIKNAIEWIDD